MSSDAKGYVGKFHGVITAAARSDTYPNEQTQKSYETHAGKIRGEKKPPLSCGYVEVKGTTDGSGFSSYKEPIPFYTKNGLNVGDEVTFDIRHRHAQVSGSAPYAAGIVPIGKDTSFADKVGTRKERDSGWEKE